MDIIGIRIVASDGMSVRRFDVRHDTPMYAASEVFDAADLYRHAGWRVVTVPLLGEVEPEKPK